MGLTYGLVVVGESGDSIEVGADNLAALVTPRPNGYANSFSWQGPRGAGVLAGAYKNYSISGALGALAANSEVWQMRFTSLNSNIEIKVPRVQVCVHVTTAAAAAALASLQLFASRSFTVDGSGGTVQAAGALNNSKSRIIMPRPQATIRIASTAALTAGTETLDAQPLSSVAFGIGTAALTTGLTAHALDWDDGFLLEDDPTGVVHPFHIAVNEGLVIRTGAAMPASIVWQLGVRVSWNETMLF